MSNHHSLSTCADVEEKSRANSTASTPKQTWQQFSVYRKVGLHTYVCQLHGLNKFSPSSPWCLLKDNMNAGTVSLCDTSALEPYPK